MGSGWRGRWHMDRQGDGNDSGELRWGRRKKNISRNVRQVNSETEEDNTLSVGRARYYLTMLLCAKEKRQLLAQTTGSYINSFAVFKFTVFHDWSLIKRFFYQVKGSWRSGMLKQTNFTAWWWKLVKDKLCNIFNNDLREVTSLHFKKYVLSCTALYLHCTSNRWRNKGLLHFIVPYPMSPRHPVECSKNMGLIINLCASSCHPRPAGLLERTQAKNTAPAMESVRLRDSVVHRIHTLNQAK